MTLAEKASQMRYQAPAIPRLKIPEYNWWNEALHGIVRFTIGPEQLACHEDDGTPRVEPGEFEVTIGGGQPGVEDWGAAPCAVARFTVE
jgi:hypothetical protein